ncbi:TonB-dependent receptor [Fibrisoma montanum]|uniref:TonB-dependent receptor n=1 Tax=Fibrisoma montanum TaxID=2305895 RepID=A0A418LXK9_9BACT|nr:carboxypeptidase-like regulatory domain-containing protein [Fibrisoma montanum]RIV17965.1 TonB-dependent receptor [Fibrisoma montanum]
MIRIYSIGLILLTALLLLPFTVFAQKIRVQGTATYNGIRPLPNVSISLDGSYDGATTDDKGRFTFETEENGPFKLIARVAGFVDVAQPIELNGATTVVATIVFTTKAVTLNDVTVRPRLFDLTDKNKYTVMSPLDVLTTATDGNITSALRTLPGAQPVGESGDLFVRGGTGTETRVYIDGLLVNNFTYSSPSNMAARSRFAPGMFKGTFFSTGGYSAQYGQALSSALVLETEDLPVKSSAELTLSPVMAGATLEKLSRDKKTVYGGGISHTSLRLYNLLAPATVLFTKTPRYWDGNGFVRRQFSNGGMLKFFVNGGLSDVGLDRPNLDYEGVVNNIRLTNRNLYTNLTYRRNLNRGWKWQAGLSYNYNTDLTNVAARVDGGLRADSLVRQADRSALWQARSVVSKLILARTRLHVGTELQRVSEQRNDSRNVDTFLAQFAETESYLTDRLSARIGLRFEYASVLRKANVAPRLALGYSTGTNGLLSVSYGRFYQKPERQFLWQTTDIGYTNADHYIASYQQLANDRTFRAEGFFKRYNHLIRTTPNLDNGGWGYARGVEVFFRDKKSIKGVDYWLSYSFLDTKRLFLDYPTVVQPSFAARHTASAVVKRFFSAVQTNIGLSYTYGSGRPYVNPNRPVEAFMTDRTPPYHNLGLSIAHLMSVRKAQSVLVLTVSNALGNRQVFGYTYSTRHPERREAIVPTNNPFVFVGLFVTLGADRRQEIINSQL